LKALKALEQVVGAKPLPKKLLLQMDNCLKDNKNRHLLVFLSLSIVNEVFEKVQLEFLVIGHTLIEISQNITTPFTPTLNQYIHTKTLMEVLVICQKKLREKIIMC
jgi:hypothetical protein